MKTKNLTKEEVAAIAEIGRKFGTSVQELGRKLGNAVKVFQESKTAFDELKKVKKFELPKSEIK